MTTTEPHTLTRHAAAMHLGISVKTLDHWRLSDRGPAYSRLGSLVRYTVEDLDDYLAACRVTPSTTEE